MFLSCPHIMNIISTEVTSVSFPKTAGIFASGAVAEPRSLQDRLGKKLVGTCVVSSTTSDEVDRPVRQKTGDIL